jgi:hypothetical protein
MWRHDLETTKKCVWIENLVSDNFNVLIGDHDFPPDCNVMITDNYLNFPEQNLNAYKYHVIMLGDFNIPNYGWINGVPHPNFYFFNKMKGNSIHTATRFLGPDQYNNSVVNTALLYLVFSHISDLSASISSSLMVTPGIIHHFSPISN